MPDTEPEALYLGVDLGTSACRLCVIDDAGEERAWVRANLPAPHRQGVEVDQTAQMWWSALEQAMEALCSKVSPGSIRSMAVDGTSGTLLLCDPDGRPGGPALMYSDARATGEARRIAAVAPAECGAHGATSSLAKLLFLQGTAAADHAAHALHQADWVSGRLTGQFGVSDENNALKLGYDPVRRRWPDWLVNKLGVPRAWLPRVEPPGTSIGPLAPEWSRRWGLGSDVLVATGTTDSTAGFIATGARQPGEAVTALGSTLVVKVLADKPVFAPRYGVYSHRLGNLWLAGGASNTGGAVLRRFFSDRDLERLTPRLQPQQPTGLDYYPLPAVGERFPDSAPGLEPRLEPRPDDDATFLQGLLEGIAAIEARGYRRLADLGAPYPAHVLTVGGGAVNAAWTAIRARLLGVPVTAAPHQEAAYGAALLARRAWGG
ncbi:MAG TPA: FGGY-family carbohydrate kinase [Gammaproteobacteria bacterium]|nr:FGGY-family carbohydrate kinase [Gammaproteobacteria bacterium]